MTYLVQFIIDYQINFLQAKLTAIFIFKTLNTADFQCPANILSHFYYEQEYHLTNRMRMHYKPQAAVLAIVRIHRYPEWAVKSVVLRENHAEETKVQWVDERTLKEVCFFCRTSVFRH